VVNEMNIERKRITKKSRMLDAIGDVMVEMYLDGVRDPSIDRVAGVMCDNSLVPSTANSIRGVFLDELTNEVTRYFVEVSKIVSAELGNLPFHHVNHKYYSKGKRTPNCMEEAIDYVTVSGRGGKTQGVRFISGDGAKTDYYYAAYLTFWGAIEDTRRANLTEKIQEGTTHKAIGETEVKKLPEFLHPVGNRLAHR